MYQWFQIFFLYKLKFFFLSLQTIFRRTYTTIMYDVIMDNVYRERKTKLNRVSPYIIAFACIHYIFVFINTNFITLRLLAPPQQCGLVFRVGTHYRTRFLNKIQNCQRICSFIQSGNVSSASLLTFYSINHKLFGKNNWNDFTMNPRLTLLHPAICMCG